MNFRQLETFRWIAKLGNFAAAAEKLNATQSTISARIQELERSLGVTLFDRSGRTAHLTMDGRSLLPFAEEAYALARRIRSEVINRTNLSGLVRIGVGEIVALAWLPAMLNRLAARYPKIEIELIVDLTVKLNRMLEADQLDVIIAVGSHPSPRMYSRSVGHAPMRWAASPSLNLGGRALSAADLAGAAVYSLSRDSHLYIDLLEWFSSQSIKPKRIHGCNSIAATIALTRDAAGIAVLPTMLIAEDLNSSRLELLDAVSPVDSYEFFVSHERSTGDPAVLAIVEVALESTDFRVLSTGERQQHEGSGPAPWNGRVAGSDAVLVPECRPRKAAARQAARDTDRNHRTPSHQEFPGARR